MDPSSDTLLLLALVTVLAAALVAYLFGRRPKRPRRLFRLTRQLSQTEGAGERTCFCTYPLGVRLGDPDDVRLGCGCAIHYHCLVAYLQSKIGDRATMSLRGIACPYGGDCRSHQAEPTPGRSSVYFVTLEDLDNIVDYRNAERAGALDALLRENETEPLTHEDVGALRAWLEENDLLQALRELLGDPSVTQPEMLELARLGEAKEPAFRSLVRQRGALAKKKVLLSYLANMRMVNPVPVLDPYVDATTKACPTCSFRGTHWHGHRCHHISPVDNGCPNCHVHYCYRCLTVSRSGSTPNCDCILANINMRFCKPIRSVEDVEQFVRLNQGIPFDSRCGCVICNFCRQGRPCKDCSGDCGVCTGLLNPSPIGIGETAWVALKSGGAVKLSGRLRLFDACRARDKQGLAAVLAKAREAGLEATLVNSLDSPQGRSCLIEAVDVRDVQIVEMLCRVRGIDANLGRINGNTALIYAASQGCTEIVQALLAVPGIDSNARDNHFGRTAFIWSAMIGHTQVVRALAAAPGVDVNACDAQFPPQSALVWAVKCGHTETVRLLASIPGADPNVRGDGGLTILLLAARNWSAEMVQILLAVPGIDVNASCDSEYGSTALIAAAVRGSSEIVRALLNAPATRGIDVNARGDGGITALTAAARNGTVEAVQALLAVPGIDANARTDAGVTALISAVEMGNIEIVAALLAVPGIDVNAKGNSGTTALTAAGSSMNLEMVQMLLTVPGIDVNAGSPLIGAVSKGHSKVVQALLAVPGIDINAMDNTGVTVLGSAVETSNIEIVTALLAVPGIDVNTRLFRQSDFKYGNTALGFVNTALSVAARQGCTEIVQVLLTVPGIDVNASSPLIWAVSKGHSKVVQALLAVPDLQINARDIEDVACKTLFVAAGKGQVDLVRVLLSPRMLAVPGIDIVNSRVDRYGNTALIYAASQGCTEIVQVLLAVPGIDINAKTDRAPALKLALDRGVKGRDDFRSGKVDVYAMERDDKGYSALLCAAKNGDSEMVRVLANAPGIDINARGDGFTALMLAVRSAQAKPDAIQTILALNVPGVDVNAKGSDYIGETVLMAAAGAGCNAIVEALLAFPGIDINARDDRMGRTALMKACINGQIDTVGFLLAVEGIDIAVRDKHGKRALDNAGSDSIKQLLTRGTGGAR